MSDKKLNRDVYDVISELRVIDTDESLLNHLIDGLDTDTLKECITDYVVDNDLDDYLETDKDELISDVFDKLDDVYNECKDFIHSDLYKNGNTDISVILDDLRDVCIDYNDLYGYYNCDLYMSEVADFDNGVNKCIELLSKVNKKDTDELVDELKENGIL